ncbi:MAG TPA: DUF2071 domain-containing protein [Blastocatellia bacterium]|nr:DUF2071 domain-containing protein [Blastocatellia bacterium]
MRDSRPFLTAEWRYLLVANYAVDPALLKPLVPAGTELDVWDGLALVSLVGFRFLRTSVLGVPIPFHRNFDEVNLRYYVRRKGPDGVWRRGVSFVREIVPRTAIALVARLVYNEPYVSRRMRHSIGASAVPGGGPATVSYGWSDGGRWHTLSAATTGTAAQPPAGTEGEFTIEHYWGYTRQRDGGTMEYHVDHVPWRIWQAASVDIDVDVARVYGAQWAGPLEGPPRLTLVAEGSPVSVYPGTRIV